MSPSAQYYPIRLYNLVLDTVLDFDIYMKVEECRYLLYRNRDLKFTQRHRDNLISHGIDTLYVSRKDKVAYSRYLECNISTIVNDPDIDEKEKADLIYTVSRNLVLEVLENPRAGDIVKRTEQVTAPTVDFILREKDALRHLISIMSYDYYTYTHSLNVCVFAVALAHHIGFFSRNELNDLASGALLHDVGKSQVPKEILAKAGKLTAQEMDIVKTHVVLGEQLLADNARMTPSRILPLALHHERMDGSGYPRGFRGNQISLQGRIAAVVDCFDAMTTNRAYCSAISAFEAFRVMQTKGAEAYDQDLVASFIRLLNPA